MTGERIPKILVVEDCVDMQNAVKDFFRGRAQILSALTMEEAMSLFKEHPDIELITMDGNVPKSKGCRSEFTGELVENIRASFKGPIIAASLHDDYSDALMAKGCSHRCSKMYLLDKISEVLGIADPKDL